MLKRLDRVPVTRRLAARYLPAEAEVTEFLGRGGYVRAAHTGQARVMATSFLRGLSVRDSPRSRPGRRPRSRTPGPA
jgi:hypothetical protein